MSLWVYLSCDSCGEPFPVDDTAMAETRPLRLCGVAELNISSSRHFDFRSLDGKDARDTVVSLVCAGRAETPDDRARMVCVVFAEWARQHPGGVWRVSG